MKSKYTYALFTIVLTIFLTACGGTSALENDPNSAPDTPTLSVNLSSISLNLDASIDLEVEAKKVDGTNDTFTVVSSDTVLADVTVSATTVTVNAYSSGDANITITSSSGNVLVIPVNIVEKAESTLTIDKTTIIMDVNTSELISASATTDGITSDTMEVFSSDTNILTVSINENNITVTAISEGTATVTVSSGSDKNATCDVEVRIPGEASLSLSMTTHSMNAETTAVLVATATIDGTIEDNITAISSDTSVLDINVTDNNITMSAISAGIATVTVTSGSDKNATCIVIVNALDNELVVNAEYIVEYIDDDNGKVYPLNAQYGKLYEIWITDGMNQPSFEYTLDVLASVYNSDNTKAYLSDENQNYAEPILVNPIKTEQLFIEIKPRVSGAIGTYSIKIVEKDSLSDGMKSVPFPLTDSITHNSYISNTAYVNDWSYYSTNAVVLTTKTISLDNISFGEELFIKIFEDADCTDEIVSTHSGTSNNVSLSHTYSKSGTFCIGVSNPYLSETSTYDIQVVGNKTSSVVTYNSDVGYSIPDNNSVGVSSPIEVQYGVTSISNVTVNMNISHQYDADLSAYLVSPNGVEVALSIANGSSGNDYINTSFDDNATISISDDNASAPFTGTFIPDSALSVLNDTSANGIWNLKVTDTTTGDTGRIESWSIIIE